MWLKEKKRLLIGLGTLIIVILLLIIVDIPSLLLKISIIGIWGLILFVFIYTIVFLLRSFKLNLIFKGLDKAVNFQTSFFSIGVCFIVNDLTPGKVGDLAKIGIIKDQENLKLSETVSGVTIERFFDLLISSCTGASRRFGPITSICHSCGGSSVELPKLPAGSFTQRANKCGPGRIGVKL